MKKLDRLSAPIETFIRDVDTMVGAMCVIGLRGVLASLRTPNQIDDLDYEPLTVVSETPVDQVYIVAA